jgi:hypothetical protein
LGDDNIGAFFIIGALILENLTCSLGVVFGGGWSALRVFQHRDEVFVSLFSLVFGVEGARNWYICDIITGLLCFHKPPRMKRFLSEHNND